MGLEESAVLAAGSRGKRVMRMFKSLLAGACLLVLMAGCASAPQKSVAAADTKSRTCLDSGSRIPRDCAPGQSYTGDDIRQTGRVGDVAAALRQLDPVVH
jgi:hypothetical protein